MSQVSKRVLSPSIQERLFQNFWDMFADIKSAKDIQIFLEDFLSPTEKVMLAKRMTIAILFAKGHDHRSISSMLKVSTSTINNIAKFLQAKTPGYELLIKKYSQKEATKELLKDLERTLYRFSSPNKVFLDEDLIKAKLGHRKKVF